MKKSITGMFVMAALLMALPLEGSGQASQSEHSMGGAGLERVLVESANTPAEHEALATYFRGKAGAQRESAANHRWMAKNYGGSLRGPQVAAQKTHCEKLANLHEQTAAQYDEMAKVHEEAAKAK
jgi:hypothetical protein